jgi:saccharopine dehydrogenase-like NADP-dependent oxidoreductase
MLMAEVADSFCTAWPTIARHPRRYGAADMATSSSTELRVAVLGAGGTIAPAIVADLASSEEVSALMLLDLDGEKARRTAERHGGVKAASHAVDARDPEALARSLQDVDVLVNTASYRVNLEAMSACLQAGSDYLDLGGLYWVTKRQLELHDAFDRAGLLAVLGIGSSPGKTNLMARQGAALLPRVSAIEVVAGGRDPVAASDGRLRPPYAIQTLVDELTLAPIVLRAGVPVEIDPLSDGGVVDFGDPIGAGETIFTLHSELVTFGESFGADDVTFRLSLAPALLERLKQLTGASPEAIAQATRDAAAPSDQTVSVHIVSLRGEHGETVTVRAHSTPHFGIGGSIVSTAAPIAAAVRLIARGEVTATGALPPEACIEPAAMFAELETRGCSFSVETAGSAMRA